MSRDPQRPDAPRIDSTSDEEFIRTILRAERTELPSAAKIQELANRVRPKLTRANAVSSAWRPLVIVALAGAFVVATLSVRRFGSAQPSFVDEGAPRAAASPPPPAWEEPIEVAPPGISVDSLPAASAPTRVRTPTCVGELEIVERADAALRAGAAQRALDLAHDHEARCPSGDFVQERERVAIEALARLHRSSEARARARAFERRFPSSPHAWRIRSLVEGDAE